MDEKNLKLILENLEQFNAELDLEEYQTLTLNTYNEQFKNKLINSNNTLINDEELCEKNINNITFLIEQNKSEFANKIELSKKSNEVKFDESYLLNRELYDQEIKLINEEINDNDKQFEKELTSISSTTYYKQLDIKQTKNDYLNYLKDIKLNYINSLEFFHERKEKKIDYLNEEVNSSKIELEESLKKTEKSAENVNFVDEEDKIQKLSLLNKELESNEKIIFNQKNEMNSQIEFISNKYKLQLVRYVTPLKIHMQHLNEELSNLKQKVKNSEIKCLDTFKLNLEIIDKQLEIQKLKSSNRMNEITSLLKIEESSSLRKEYSKIENDVAVFSESMRAKKLEYDLKKTFDIELLNLKYKTNRNIVEAKIELIQTKLKTVEDVSNFNEYVQLGKLRHDIDVRETKIKNEIDNIIQKKYLVDSIEKLKNEFDHKLQTFQIKLQKDSIKYNDNYFEKLKNNISTLTSLEIEKNLILKKYNINLNELLNEKLFNNSKIINIDEKYTIKDKKSFIDYNKKMLSQDIQFANKKLDLMKNIALLERNLADSQMSNKMKFELEIKTYNIFENRFSIEKSLYKIYFENIKFLIETIELYYNKYNQVTRCKNVNITFSTFEYLTKHLQKEVTTLFKKIINVISNRITFEGTINFQYELNRLVSEKDQNEAIYNVNIEKYEQTIKNYENTILLYNEKISSLDKKNDRDKNTLIMKDFEIAHTDVKNSVAISKIHQDIEILKDNIIKNKKESKTYVDLISKNKKSIAELNKIIPSLKKKYLKVSNEITNQLNTIEKRHKQESSVYYNFISKIEQLITDINTPLLFDDVKDSVYNYFKKYTSSIYSSILNFQTYEIDALFNKLSSRHDSIINNAEVKYSSLVDETNNIYNNDLKRISNNYSEQLFEIEKKIDKINSQYLITKREIQNDSKEKISEVKLANKQIDIELNQRKATFLYDINTFVENIDQHSEINNKSIEKLKQKKETISQEYFEYNEKLEIEKNNKIKHLENQCDNVIASLKLTYNGIIEEKTLMYQKKESSYKERILISNKNLENALIKFNIFLSTVNVEENVLIKSLEKKLESDLYSLKKSSLTKINRENKKYNKTK